MKSRALKSDTCLNCGQELQDENYCPNCGQKNDARRLTTRHFIEEAISTSFAVDGRLLTTLRYLVTYPGKVARDFVEGKRVRYMNPIRLYFISSIILLFIIQTSRDQPEFVKTGDLSNRKANTVQSDSLDGAKKDAMNLIIIDPENKELDNHPVSSYQESKGSFSDMMDFHQDYPDIGADIALDSLNQEPTFWNRFLFAQAAKAADFDTNEFNQYFLSKLFWILFLFVPVLGIILHLVHFRRPFYYPEHLIFAFYSQALFFLLSSLALVTTVYLIFPFVIYLLWAMKRFYKQGWGKTILKFVLVNMLLSPALLLFTILSMLVVFIML